MLILKSPKFCVTYANGELATFAGKVHSIFNCQDSHFAFDTANFLTKETGERVDFVSISGKESKEFFSDDRGVDLIWVGRAGKVDIDGVAHQIYAGNCGSAITAAFELLRGIDQGVEFLA